jgi:hypothetical protein
MWGKIYACTFPKETDGEKPMHGNLVTKVKVHQGIFSENRYSKS